MKTVRKMSNSICTVSAILGLFVFAMFIAGCGGSDDGDNVSTTVWYMDADGDGHGDPNISRQADTQPAGYVSNNTDCDDNDAGIHPGATDTCGDNIDQNCNGSDSTCEALYYRDTDGDGYGDSDASVQAGTQPVGYVSNNTDCNDNDADVHPNATEVCGDAIDQNCDGGDLACGMTVYYKDADGDGYSDGTTLESVREPDGYYEPSELTSISGDCDDDDADVNPGAVETCNDGRDNDCNGNADCNDAVCSDDFACDGETFASFQVADTDQATCYDDAGAIISCPSPGASFHGQDAQYAGAATSYTDNGDGTVTDNNTGLMWQQNPGDKMYHADAVAGASSFNLAGYSDWRLPAIKELYSLIRFNGTDPSGLQGNDTSGITPFINADHFDFEYGDPSVGERIIDSQWATSTIYTSTTMGGNSTMFGVNFADGRIKGYPKDNKTFFVIYVRGNTEYGDNDFTDNGDGAITDSASGLMWQQNDSGPHNWENALAYCESLRLAGRDDWRLPNAKELQSIVDYTRSPDATGSAAIDPLFNVTSITNEGGQTDYPFYWTGTTHANYTNFPGGNAAYVAFGRALGYMNGQWTDVHGAGAQRSDPKTGDPDDYPTGHGPQGDAIRIYNYARCVCDVQ